jgi:telomere length regulation protein
MEDLLTPVSTAYKKPKSELDGSLTEAQSPVEDLSRSLLQPCTPEEALDILRGEPDLERLSATLNYLINDAPSISKFQITHPSPMAAQIINVLVSNVLPSYWPILKETSSSVNRKSPKDGLQRRLLLSCLRSISGLNAVMLHLKALIQAAKEANKDSRKNHIESLEDQLDVLENILRGETLISHLWKDLSTETVTKKKALWREVTAVVGGGKLVSGAAEATSLVNDASAQIKKTVWVADGNLYSRWLARNIIHWFQYTQEVPEGSWNPFPELFAKSIRLGYPGKFPPANSQFNHANIARNGPG